MEPTLIIDGGAEFGINLGAPVRLHLWGGGEGTGLVRQADWDSLSDWGQLVRGLKLGSDNAPVALWVGGLESYSLLSAHLVRRYSNRTHPNYHPAGAFLTGTLGPLYAEAFASDVLGARLLGAEIALDVQHVLFGPPPQRGRYTLALSAVHDWGMAGGQAPPVTLAHLDGTAVVVVRPGLEAHLFAGWGGKPSQGSAWGAVVGAGADAVTPTLDMALRLEARMQRGGFRQGAVGPDYELARFLATGPEGVPLAEAPFPDGFSLYGEAVVGWDAVHYGGLRKHLQPSLGAEAFTWGRVDMDGRMAVQLFGRNLEVAVKGLVVGLGGPEHATWAPRRCDGASSAGPCTHWGRVAHCCFQKAKARCARGLSSPWALGWTMHADSPRARWRGLLALALLSTGCVSLTPHPGRGTGLGYTPQGAAPRALAHAPGEEVAHGPSTSTPPDAPGRLYRRRPSREAVTGADPGHNQGAVENRQSGPQARQALLAALLDMSGATRRLSSELSTLRASEPGIAKAGVFLPFVAYGEAQLRWMDGGLSAASTLAHTAREVEDADMQLALLRLAGPRLEATLLASLLLAAWVDFLHLADFMLRHCQSCGVETLLRQMDGWQKLLEPPMTALASREPGQVEAAAADLPALMGHLAEEYAAKREALRVARENLEKFLVLKEALEALPLLSAMRLALPRLLVPAAPASLGVSLGVGSGGVMMGTQVVVSAEWVEMMRWLVQAGVLSLPAVSAAVRIQAGQVLMAQSNDELPQGVREALGDSPEVRGMRVTGRAGAGMAEPPRHHVLPQEHRAWFEQRGFTGDMDIDQFCVRMEKASHEAIHGGGNWKLGRIWPGEWNQMIMKVLRDAELESGRMLTQREVLKVVAGYMKEYKIPMSFMSWSGR